MYMTIQYCGALLILTIAVINYVKPHHGALIGKDQRNRHPQSDRFRQETPDGDVLC